MDTPYLLFLGDAPDQLAAKTADGIAYWRPDWCVGQLRLEGCNADSGLEDISVSEAAARGARTLVIGVVNSGGFMPESWTDTIIDALRQGMDVASGLHARLQSFPAIAKAAEQYGRDLINVRHSDQVFSTGKGIKRSGKRLLTVGTDCSVGKKYTALAIEREMQERGMKADFRATGQTGVMIARRGVAIDAVIADFISGAAEWLSPDNDADHWDIVEGQGSLYHAAFAGVTAGLIHGSQPDAMVLCHEPTRTHMRGLPHAPLPDLKVCADGHVGIAHLTNPNCRLVGVAVNASLLQRDDALALLDRIESELGVPCVDPIAIGVERIVDSLS